MKSDKDSQMQIKINDLLGAIKQKIKVTIYIGSKINLSDKMPKS